MQCHLLRHCIFIYLRFWLFWLFSLRFWLLFWLFRFLWLFWFWLLFWLRFSIWKSSDILFAVFRTFSMPLCGRFIRLIRAIRRSGETGDLANMQQFKNMASNDEKRTRIDRCLHLPKGGGCSRNGSCNLFNLTFIIYLKMFLCNLRICSKWFCIY